MGKNLKEEILISEKFASIVILIANLNDKVSDLIEEVHEIRTKLGQIQTKQLYSTKPLLDKEDYE